MRFSTLAVWTFWAAVVYGTVDMLLSVGSPTLAWGVGGVALFLVYFVTSLSGEGA